MNKKLLILFGGVLLMLGTLMLADQSISEETLSDENPNPDYLQFFHHLRKNEHGVIPSGMTRQWFQTDKANFAYRKGILNLENIKEFGPDSTGGRTRSVVIDWSDTSTLFAGSVSGGFWKSTDAGRTWEANNDFAPTLGVSAITQSPFDADMVYYSTGEVVRGLTNENGLGIFRSSDHAETFEHLEHTATADFDETWDIEHSLVYDSTIYVATYQSGLWRSTDAGESFEKINNYAGHIYEIEVFADSIIMFAASGKGIIEMHERTLEINELDNGFATGVFSRVSFDYCKSFPNVMVAHLITSNGRDFHSAYKSSNRGKTWVKMPDVTASATDVSYAQGYYDFKVAIAPWDSNFIISAAVQAAYTTNGGFSWAELDRPRGGDYSSHVDHHDIVFYNRDSFIDANDGGIYRFRMNDLRGASDLNRGYNATQFYAGGYGPEGDIIVAGTQDNGSHYNNYSDKRFRIPLWGDGAYAHVHQQFPDLAYVSSQYLGLRRIYKGAVVSNSYIGGFILSRVGQTNLHFINPYEVNPLDGDQLFVSTKLQIYRSNNRGSSWTAFTENLLGESYSLGLSNSVDPMLYVGGSASVIYRIDDARNAQAGDEVWISREAPTEFKGSYISCIKVQPDDSSVIYCGMTTMSTNPRIWKITNADTETPTFTPIHANLPSMLPINSIEIDPDDSDFIIIATDYGIYTTNNGGGWWEKEDRFPNINVQQLRIRHSDRKLFVYSFGRGLWTIDLAENPQANVKDLDASNIAIYPNPATDIIQINGIKTDALKLYDQNGKLVLETQGSKANIQALPQGIYFVEVRAGDKTFVKKLIVSK